MPDILCYHFVPTSPDDRKWEAILAEAEVIRVNEDGTLKVGPLTSPESTVSFLERAVNNGRRYGLPVLAHELPDIETRGEYKPEHTPVKREISHGKLWLNAPGERSVSGGYFRVRVVL